MWFLRAIKKPRHAGLGGVVGWPLSEQRVWQRLVSFKERFSLVFVHGPGVNFSGVQNVVCPIPKLGVGELILQKWLERSMRVRDHVSEEATLASEEFNVLIHMPDFRVQATCG
jgi:hypothetical protein